MAKRVTAGTERAGRARAVKLDGSHETSLHPGLIVAGVDEVGRGPLAGPVAAAAVILDAARLPEGLRDSKALSVSARERLFAEIVESAAVGIAFASPAEIDALNIRRASLLAMRRAVSALPRAPDIALIDGRDVPDGLPCAAQAVIRGDSTFACIAAASIVAKVVRDRAMARLDAIHPEYGFIRHAGYPTPAHLEALSRAGPCRFHRMSFAPVRRMVDKG
ncbi:MAG: ribonuclease HII [Salinarimonadaceae bacterium]|nr:MAG: ribonuclease HII [Salinarimonadaceae bacterium]